MSMEFIYIDRLDGKRIEHMALKISAEELKAFDSLDRYSHKQVIVFDRQTRRKFSVGRDSCNLDCRCAAQAFTMSK